MEVVKVFGDEFPNVVVSKEVPSLLLGDHQNTRSKKREAAELGPEITIANRGSWWNVVNERNGEILVSLKISILQHH